MKAKLLKKLRKEIFDNSDIEMISPWSGCLYTTLKGVRYYGERHSTVGFSINSESIGQELEHIALEGYLKSKKR